MKKLGTFLVVLAVSMFALGCGGTKTGSKTTEKTKIEKTGEGGKTVIEKTTINDESKKTTEP